MQEKTFNRMNRQNPPTHTQTHKHTNTNKIEIPEYLILGLIDHEKKNCGWDRARVELILIRVSNSLAYEYIGTYFVVT